MRSQQYYKVHFSEVQFDIWWGKSFLTQNRQFVLKKFCVKKTHLAVSKTQIFPFEGVFLTQIFATQFFNKHFLTQIFRVSSFFQKKI